MKSHLIAAALTLGLALPASAQENFFKDKTITYIIATQPGGGYDAYARLIGKYLGEQLGTDKILFKNIPGAGHLVGANTLAASKPDGLTIGTFNTGLIYSQILQREGQQFNLRDLGWIGKAASDPRVMVIAEDSDIADFEALRAREEPVKFAAAGVGSASYTDTNLIASAFDLPIEIIPGFNGNEGEMAMMRNEVVGQVASLSSIQPFIDAGNGKIILAVGGDHQPQAKDLVDSEKAGSIINLVEAMSVLGRLTAAPAGVPEDRLQQIRDAYTAALADPDLLAEAEKLGIPIEPADGETVARMVSDALNQSPESVQIIAAAVDVEVPTVVARGPILSLEDENKWVEFNSGDQPVKAKISGSRTKITIDGADATRDALEAGMECRIEYDPNAEDNEPKSMECTS